MITKIEVNRPTKVQRIATGEVLLSISLLVSNQIKTIRKCMESIRPLLEQVPSELIIVDTVGEENSDGSLAVAKEYADKIVHFTWCDDFAAARNAGLNECSGQWFMFLDDDEYYDDVTPLIDFFSNPKLVNEYNSVNVYGRHYESYKGEKYNERKSIRLFRKVANAKFVGKVHEHFTPTLVPTYTTEAYVHHFGYVHVVDKTDRNESILEEMVKVDPLNYSAWLQLIISYPLSWVMKKIALAEEALSYYKSDIQLADNTEKALCEVIINLVGYYQQMGMFKKAEQLLLDYNEFLNVNMFRKGLYFHSKIIIDLAQFNYETVVENYKKYQESVKYYLNHEQEFSAQYTPFFKETITEAVLVKTLTTITSKLIDARKHEELVRLFEIVEWEIFQIEVKDIFFNFIKAAILSKKDSMIIQLAQYCYNNELLEDFIRICQSLMFEMKPNQRQLLINYLSEIASLHSFFEYQKYLKNSDELIFKEIVNKIEYYETGIEPILIEMVSQGYKIDNILQTATLEELETFCNYIDLCFEGDFEKEVEFIKKLTINLEEDILVHYFTYQIIKKMLLKPSMTTMELEQYLIDYLTSGQNLAVQLYDEAIYTNMPMLLPSEYHWLAVLEQALTYKNQGKLVEYIRMLKEGLQIYPVAKELVEKLMTLAQRELRKQQSIEAELVRLANQVKADILKLISEENYAEARAVYQELQQIVPNDESLKAIEQLLK